MRDAGAAVWGTVVRSIAQAPLTATLIVAVVVVHVVSGSFLGRLADLPTRVWGFQSIDLLEGRWWNVLTTVILSSSTASMVLGVAVVGIVLGLAEVTVGTWRATVLFIASQVTAVVLYGALVAVSSRVGLDMPDGFERATLLGPFAASAGALMAASQGIALLWRRRVRVLMLAIAVMLSVYVGHAQHVLILLAVVVGLVIGKLALPALGTGSFARSTSREVRTNLALIVSVFAVGPLVAAMAHVPQGPLAVLRTWITTQDPVSGGCLPGGCHVAGEHLGLLGSSGHLLALMPMVLLLACAEGLRRGNRLALWIAVYAHLLIGVISAFYFQVFAGLGMPIRHGHRTIDINESVWELLPVVLVPVVIAGLLVAGRHHFRVDPDPARRRRIAVFLPMVVLVLVGLYTLVWLLEDNEHGRLGMMGLFASIPRLILPYPFPFSYAESVYPRGFFSELIFSYGGVLLWLVSGVSILTVFLSRARRSEEGQHEKAQALVRRGGGSLSWMTLWSGNQYWFNTTESVAVAYQEHNGVAVTVGGPIGEASEMSAALDGFLHYCAQESLTPAFYSVAQETVEALGERGFNKVPVAAETILDVRTMEFKGKDWQNIRTAVNKAGKLGVSAQWTRYGQLSSGQRTQVHEISEDWVSGQALPELGFTLGGLEELKDENVQLCLAIDDTGRIHAVTSWLPVYSHGQVVSWTLDFMRRNSGAYNGVMEFLIAEAVNHFKESVEYISLSGSPLANSQEQDNSLGKVLGLLARTLEPVYGFASLANFKQRFKPRHESWYLMYQDPLSLPAMGGAVAQAYMPTLSVRSVAKMLRSKP